MPATDSRHQRASSHETNDRQHLEAWGKKKQKNKKQKIKTTTNHTTPADRTHLDVKLAPRESKHHVVDHVTHRRDLVAHELGRLEEVVHQRRRRSLVAHDVVGRLRLLDRRVVSPRQRLVRLQGNHRSRRELQNKQRREKEETKREGGGNSSS